MAARRPVCPPSAPETARIARIGADGDGIADLPDGSRRYVPFTLPGERVTLRRTARRGDGFAAIAQSIDDASSARAQPPCPHFGRCGGCTLQHWQIAPYREWKTGLLRNALRRAGYDVAPAPLASTPPAARRRFDMAAIRQGSRVALGLHVSRGTAVVDLHTCAVLHPALAALLDPLRAVLSALAALRRQAAVIGNLLDTGPDLLLRTDASLTAPDRAQLADFARTHRLPRVAWARGGDAPEIAAQLRPATVTFGGIAVTPPPGAFLQASAAGARAIVAAVCAGLPENLPPRAWVAELFAGCGTLTFPLGACARVAAFEGDGAAAAALAAAVNEAGQAGRIVVARRDLARQPLVAAELSRFAAVILDPPHAGAAAQVAQIAASAIPRVIYVSCNPAALARDAATLRTAGYRVLSAQPIDQFLWSARLESVVVFAR